MSIVSGLFGEKIRVPVATFLIVNIIATALWYLLPQSHLINCWSDALFLIGTTVACMGFITAILAKSRRHYYLHLRGRFSGKIDNDEKFELEQKRRNQQATVAVLVAIGGALGIIASALVVYLSVPAA